MNRISDVLTINSQNEVQPKLDWRKQFEKIVGPTTQTQPAPSGSTSKDTRLVDPKLIIESMVFAVTTSILAIAFAVAISLIVN